MDPEVMAATTLQATEGKGHLAPGILNSSKPGKLVKPF